MALAVIVIIVVVCLVVYAIRKRNVIPPTTSTNPTATAPNGIHCNKCGCHDFRFLWDKQIIADNKHLEVTPSGFSNQTRQYSGTSRGVSHGFSAKGYFAFGGNPRAHHSSNRSVRSGMSSSHSESYKYKEVSVKTFRISCRCKQCGSVWKENVSEDAYPEIKKIPTMK